MAQDHAWHLAKINIAARLVGIDELISHAYLCLWELALAYKPELNVPFTAYLHMRLPNRLVDFVRHERGRVTNGVPSGKARRIAATQSLNAFEDIDDDWDDSRRAGLIDQSPGPDEIAEHREEVQRFFTWARETLNARKYEALMQPVSGRSMIEIADRHGYVSSPRGKRMRMVLDRMQAKRAAGEALDHFVPCYYPGRTGRTEAWVQLQRDREQAELRRQAAI